MLYFGKQAFCNNDYFCYLIISSVLKCSCDTLDPNAYAERLDALRENFVDGIALPEEGAADVNPASKAEARQAAAVVASMRTAHRATEAVGLVPA